MGEYDVLIPALCTVLCNERKLRGTVANSEKEFRENAVKAKKIFSNKPQDDITARLDIRLLSKDQVDFQIVSVSDDKAKVQKPAWFNKGGVGYVIQSYAGSLEIVAKANADRQIRMWLRGVDIRTPEDNLKRIPYWIYYTKLVVNDKIVFNEIIPAWHDKPYEYKMAAKTDEEIKIKVEWVTHGSDI